MGREPSGAPAGRPSDGISFTILCNHQDMISNVNVGAADAPWRTRVMPAISPQPMRAADGRRRVVAIAFEDASALDLFGVLEPFNRAVEMSEAGRSYRVSIVSPAGGPVRVAGGVSVLSETLGDDEAIDTVIVPGGPGLVAWTRTDGALRWARRLCRRARRVCGLGGGVFALAAAGLA